MPLVPETLCRLLHCGQIDFVESDVDNACSSVRKVTRRDLSPYYSIIYRKNSSVPGLDRLKTSIPRHKYFFLPLSILMSVWKITKSRPVSCAPPYASDRMTLDALVNSYICVNEVI